MRPGRAPVTRREKELLAGRPVLEQTGRLLWHEWLRERPRVLRRSSVRLARETHTSMRTRCTYMENEWRSACFLFQSFRKGCRSGRGDFLIKTLRNFIQTQERSASLAEVCLDLKRRLGRWMRYIERTSATPASVMGLSVCQ